MTHEIRMKVRDYECDLQGIVNNANYQHYTEHARHELIRSLGVSFADLHERGIDVVVARITLSYKIPLRSGDEFIVRSQVEKDKVKYIFNQDIIRASDERLSCRVQVVLATIINGKLAMGCPELDQLLEVHNS